MKPSPSGKTGQVSVDKKGRLIILIDESRTPHQQLVTLLHEVAHYALGHLADKESVEMNEAILAWRKLDSVGTAIFANFTDENDQREAIRRHLTREHQANWLAGALLQNAYSIFYPTSIRKNANKEIL